jgi:hypothetical protein
MTVHIFPLQVPPSAEAAAFNYIISLLPQLITIVAALGAGFRFLQSHNDKRVKEMEGALLAKLEVERDFVSKDMKSINAGITNLDNQYKTIVGFLKERIEQHERMLERLSDGGGVR